MSAIFVIAPSKTEFNHAVDDWFREEGVSGQRFVYVTAAHSLYGLNLTPDRIRFVDGWSNRPDAKDLIKQIEHRMNLTPAVTR
ncbi:hypothetical protein SEA_BRUHMOMENT_10 [Arthrobacter phage BruhMoment]|nr:hypothetical protein SEA_BRUHMOMENT_10 [Arthrobacter phage BruhMoment]